MKSSVSLFGGKLKHLGKKLFKINKVPKGCFPVDVVGSTEETIRYIVPFEYLKCGGRFKRLLDEYAGEIRVQTRGPITLPCPVHEFENAIYRDRIHMIVTQISLQLFN